MVIWSAFVTQLLVLLLLPLLLLLLLSLQHSVFSKHLKSASLMAFRRALLVALLLDPTTASEDAENCPWLSQNTEADNVLGCADGTTCNAMLEGWECCSSRGGRELCPPNLPNMCAPANACAGGSDYCCEEDCPAEEGGIRPCTRGGGGADMGAAMGIGFGVAMLLVVVLVGVYVWKRKTTPPRPPTTATAPPTLPPTTHAAAMPMAVAVAMPIQTTSPLPLAVTNE